MKADILRGIMERRKAFIRKNKMVPDTIFLTDNAFKKISEALGLRFNGERLLGMDVEFGNKTEVKCKSVIILEKN